MSLKLFKRRGAVIALLLAAMLPPPAAAHGFRLGDIAIDHPYAAIGPDGSVRVHLRGLRNGGTTPDRLLGASSPAAASVELRNGARVDTLALPPNGSADLRHDTGAWMLLLRDANPPLRIGDRVDLTLRFERAGEITVPAIIVQPKAAAASQTH